MKDFDFDRIGKRMPFRTPEGFFERMEEETLRRMEKEKQGKRLYRLKWGVSVALAIAAMVCGIIFLPDTQSDELPIASVEWLASNEGMDATDLYLQSLTDEELEDWIEFSENDIYYELVTENVE